MNGEQPLAICWQINEEGRGGIPAQHWRCARLRLWKQQADTKENTHTHTHKAGKGWKKVKEKKDDEEKTLRQIALKYFLFNKCAVLLDAAMLHTKSQLLPIDD